MLGGRGAGGRDEAAPWHWHCSSPQIGMTKIMEIYKARNIYRRSYVAFRVGDIRERLRESNRWCCAVSGAPRMSAGPKCAR